VLWVGYLGLIPFGYLALGGKCGVSPLRHWSESWAVLRCEIRTMPLLTSFSYHGFGERQPRYLALVLLLSFNDESRSGPFQAFELAAP